MAESRLTISLTPQTASTSSWLVKYGPRELEQLFRAVVYHPSSPVLIADDQRTYREASIGATRLLGLSRKKIIGLPMEALSPPAVKPLISELWQALRKHGQKTGTLSLLRPDAKTFEVEFLAKSSVLPDRHVLALRNTAEPENPTIPSWVQDYALFLLDPQQNIVTWYAGAERIFGYPAGEVIGRHVSLLYPSDSTLAQRLVEEFDRTQREGHFGIESWRIRKDGSRFWANAISLTLRDEAGRLQGYGNVIRDFTDRHERDKKLARSRGLSALPTASTTACIVSGEFEQIPEANDSFLALIGYSREDLLQDRFQWPDLTPAKFSVLDDLAHEEALCFGACTPYEKELICKDGSHVPVLVMTAILKLSPFRWLTFVQDLRERDRVEDMEEDHPAIQTDFSEILGNSTALRRVQQQVRVVAPADATVLILGETGTGKELVARAVHRMSPRRNRPFITLNCAAIPTGLLESELFGYERGAFTGALSQKIGRFEMAHNGTLFLDEVGDIPLELQPKLLRALQEKSFERLGGTKTIPIDVRLIAATNRNLTQMMGDKLFRSDLYYRLKVFPITTPPLRDRPEDIPILARHFTLKYAAKMGRTINKIPADTMKVLCAWPWPGNVRELENFIERSVILSRGPNLRAPLAELRQDSKFTNASDTLEQVEREYILRVLKETNGNVTNAAVRLGLQRTTLNAMMRKLGISRRDF
jgi:formate hydrogenlyase transcriptional activator